MSKDTCPRCKGPLIEIDHYGAGLVGCVKCNRWGRIGRQPDRMYMQLSGDDLQALSNLSDARHKAEDTTP